jgi:hypothetical protein
VYSDLVCSGELEGLQEDQNVVENVEDLQMKQIKGTKWQWQVTIVVIQ